MLRRSLLLAFGLFFAFGLSVKAQDCSEVFISEYVEGRSQNKGLELYNPTASPINLEGYFYIRWSNGNDDRSAVGNNIMQLSGTIPAYGTWVTISGATPDPMFGEVDPDFQDLANQLDRATHPSVHHFNGDDAIGLYKTVGGNEVLIDVFGKIGEAPNRGWSLTFPHTGNGGPSDTWLTLDKTLIRNRNILRGQSSNPAFFNPLAQWDTLGSNVAGQPTLHNFGSHNCACDPTSREGDLVSNQVSGPVFMVYPNPATAPTGLTILSGTDIVRIELIDVTGKMQAVSANHTGQGRYELATQNLVAGMYLVRLTNNKGQSSQQRVIVQ